MKLAATLDKLDGIDDAIKGFYTEKDGKFTLQVDGMETEAAVNGLRTALLKERENNNAFKKLGTPDEITAKIKGLETERDEAGKKGNSKSDEEHAAIIASMKSEHEADKTKWGEKFGTMQTKTALGDLKSELAKQGVFPDSLDYMATMGQARIKFHEDGRPKIMAEDGTSPMIGKGADGGATMADFAETLAKSQPRLVNSEFKGGSGKPTDSKDDGGKPGKTVTRQEFNNLSHSARGAFSTEGGKVVHD